MTAPTTLYELRFDNDEYYVALGLFNDEAQAKLAWDVLAEKLNRDYRTDYDIVKVTLYNDRLDVDEINVMLGEIGDHNEDATAYYEQDDDGEEEPESPPIVAPGQVNLPL